MVSFAKLKGQKGLLTKSIRLLGYLLITILCGFLLFPVWAKWMINLNLPSNMTLVDFESDYPGTGDISIQRLVLLQNGQKFSVDGLQLDYDLKFIQINHLTIEVTSQNDRDNSSRPLLSGLKLPEFSPQDLSPLQALQHVAISQLTVINDQQNFHLSKLVLNQKEPTFVVVGLSAINPLNKTTIDFELSLHWQIGSNKTNFSISENKQTVVEISHQQTDAQTQLDVRINSNSLYGIMAEMFAEMPVKTRGDITLRWLQDNLTNQVNIEAKGLLNVSPEQLKRKLRVDEKNTPAESDGIHTSLEILTDKLLIPIEFSLNSTLNNPANVKIQLNGQIANTVEFGFGEQQFILGGLNFDINTVVKLPTIKKTFQGFKLRDIHAKISGANLRLVSQALNMDMAEYKLEVVADKIEGDFKHLDKVLWHLKGVFSSPEVVGTFQKQIQADSKSSDEQHSKPDAKVKTLRLDSQMIINFELAKTEEITTSGELLLSQLQIIDPNYQLNGPFELNWQSLSTDLTKGSASLSYESYQNQVMGFDYDSLQAEANLLFTDQQIKGEGKLSINQQSLAPFAFKFDKAANRFLLELEKNQLANQVFNHFLAAIGKQNKMALEILAGEVVHSAGVGIDELFLLDSEFAIRDMLIEFGENQIYGLNVTQKLTSLEPLILQTQMDIEKINFASGLSIENVSVSLSSRSIEDINLNFVKADLLEGQLIANNLQIGANNLKTLPFQLKQISLTELIFMIDITGLYGEGKLDFSLPLSLESGSVTVDEGRFKATEEGLIKYDSGQDESMVEGNIALQALKNFRYKELDGSLSYNKDGKYHIKLHLLGANPDLYDGYPIDFVLNLRGELSGIFKSLFLTGSFEEAVMEQVKADQLEQNTKNL